MAWPSNLNHVHCEKFPRVLLPAIEDAVRSKKVEWIGMPSMYTDLCQGRFRWAGCEWMLYEITELVVSIEFINGNLGNEDLTAAVLTCKI